MKVIRQQQQQQHEKSMYDKFVEGIRFKYERYEAKLPLKEHPPYNPRQSCSLWKEIGKISSSTSGSASPFIWIRQHYQGANTDGEPVDSEVTAKAGNVHYLPHREVRTNKNTTKVNRTEPRWGICATIDEEGCVIQSQSLAVKMM